MIYTNMDTILESYKLDDLDDLEDLDDLYDLDDLDEIDEVEELVAADDLGEPDVPPFPPPRRRERGSLAKIERTAVVSEDNRNMQAQSVALFEQRLASVGLDCERQATKLKDVLNQHTEAYRASTRARPGEEYDVEFLQFLAEKADGTGLEGLSVEDFEELERRKNEDRPPEERLSDVALQLQAWHQNFTLKKALSLANESSHYVWMKSLYRCDPRWQIMRFFDEVAREGGKVPMDEQLAASPLPNLFNKASVFTVWRPTSNEAIKNMMLGIACGKGLDIKGKSARQGNISSYVPFIQIYKDEHKEECKAYMKDNKSFHIFYSSEESRGEAHGILLDIMDKTEHANSHVEHIDTHVDAVVPVFGLDVSERLFWESFVTTRDCSRPPKTEWDIARPSIPAFMEMNLDAVRHERAPGEPRAVVYQMSKSDPLEPRTLLMAYEENGGVKPVVSDFDCFILGTRGVRYQKPIPPEQVELVQWSVENISRVLDERDATQSNAGWTETWFDVLKRSEGYYPKTPQFGNGDPKSYEIIEVGVSRLIDTGCVRHGAECFNWFFPQEIDDEFLVISDTLPGNVKWKKMNVHELQEILIEKINEGFTFPINPKWILCDPGWRRVYDALRASEKPNVQDSINCWLPPETGLREEIDEILSRHPHGFECNGLKMSRTENTVMMNCLRKDMERYVKLQRVMKKLKVLMILKNLVVERKRRHSRSSGTEVLETDASERTSEREASPRTPLDFYSIPGKETNGSGVHGEPSQSAPDDAEGETEEQRIATRRARRKARARARQCVE